ncbi:uncharacterized protein METZ01_LOCUS249841, partial [marine metagenome]
SMILTVICSTKYDRLIESMVKKFVAMFQ